MHCTSTERAESGSKLESGSGLALFETAIGTCGIAWSERGIIGVQLPEADRLATRSRLGQRFPHVSEAHAPVDVLLAMGRIVALLRGERVDLTPVTLDTRGLPDFDRAVYVAAREIGPGATRTYGEIAKQIGHPNAAREVGIALARNPFAIIVPCHRVVAANGKTGGFSAGGGVKTKLKLLAIEGGAGPLFDQSGPL
jgi:methylated-DNA-[protein]-cysteine S-methyltransferase